MASRAQGIYSRNPNLVARLETNLGPVVIKWFGWRHPIHFNLSPLFPGRAWTSWEMATALEKVTARTPRPLFVYSRRQKGFIHENFFITADIHPHQKLRALLKSDAPVELMETAVIDLAVSIARMHEGGIQHRDLTSGNFLVDNAGLVYLVDLNRARRLGHVSWRQRLTDLARISFAARDQKLQYQLAQRFFQAYGAETDPVFDWEGGYWKYRKRRLRRRRLKKRLQRRAGRK